MSPPRPVPAHPWSSPSVPKSQVRQGEPGSAGTGREKRCTVGMSPGWPPGWSRAVVPVTAWTRSGDRDVWVAEGPGGHLMSVTRDTSGQWVPSVSGPGGQVRWRGEQCGTRLEVQSGGRLMRLGYGGCPADRSPGTTRHELARSGSRCLPYRVRTWATTGRMQREADSDEQTERVAVDWRTCGAGAPSGCTGVQVASFGRCWAHLSPDELRQVLRSLAPGKNLDLRGTTLDGRLLSQILSAFRDPQTRTLLIGDASLENAIINGDSPFGGAVFNGNVRFFGAKFDSKADFYGAQFKSYAGFNEAEFGYADFEKAKFSGNAVSFKYVKFRGPVEFGETIFQGRTEFIGAEFLGDALLSGIQFIRGARFERVKFHEISSFQHGKFGGFAGFGGAVFTHDADFIDVQFGGNSSFGDAEFNGDAWFHSNFCGKADFSEARFNRGAWFSKAHFGAEVAFVQAAIAHDALFGDVTFAGDALFDEVRTKGAVVIGPAKVGGKLQLNEFEASGSVEVTVAANQVICKWAKFNDQVKLSLVGGDLWLVDSAFTAPATIESSLRKVAGEGPEAGETPVRVRLRSLQGTDAEHLTLTDVDLSRCVVSGLRRPEQLRLGGRCVFAPTPRGLYWRWRIMPWRWTAREALFEEHLWRGSRAAPGPRDGWAHDNEDSEEATPERLEVLYRQLRASLEGARNEPGAADFYYGEMEMRRRAARNRSERWLLNGYWLVSGYGLRGSRALAALAALILCATLVLQHTGFPGPVPSYLYCALYAAGSVVSLSLANGHLPAVLTAWGDAIRIVLRVGGPVLLGLAALAVRGRVKR